MKINSFLFLFYHPYFFIINNISINTDINYKKKKLYINDENTIRNNFVLFIINNK